MEPPALSITEKGGFLSSPHPLPHVDEIIGYLSLPFLWRPVTFLYYRKCTAPPDDVLSTETTKEPSLIHKDHCRLGSFT